MFTQLIIRGNVFLGKEKNFCLVLVCKT